MGNAYAQVSFGEPQLINSGWKFQKGDVPEAAQPEFADNRWRTLDLPHDWSVESPLSTAFASATGYLPGGIGWYRKSLEIPASRAGQKVYIYFEGVYRNGEIFINGSPLSLSPRGMHPTCTTLPLYTIRRKKIILSVRVVHTKSTNQDGTGRYIRDVYLVYANPVLSASGGEYCHPPGSNPHMRPSRLKPLSKTQPRLRPLLPLLRRFWAKGTKSWPPAQERYLWMPAIPTLWSRA
jgi:hypothetical protein